MEVYAKLARGYVTLARLTVVHLAVPLFLLGVLMAYPPRSFLVDPYLWEGLAAVLLFFALANLVDTALRPHRGESAAVTRARALLGRRRVLRIAAVHALSIGAVAAHLALATGNLAFLAVSAAGLGLLAALGAVAARVTEEGVGYAAVRPLAFVLLPLVMSHWLVAEDIDPAATVLFAGMTGLFSFFTVWVHLHRVRNDQGTTHSDNVEEVVQEMQGERVSGGSTEQVILALNARHRKAFDKVPVRERILFLPHCLKVSERCRGTYTRDGLVCRSCTSHCSINRLKAAAEQKGYKVFVAPGAGLVHTLVAKHRPRAAVGVACVNELRMATAQSDSTSGIPYQIVMLRKSGCVDTEVDVSEVLGVIARSPASAR